MLGGEDTSREKCTCPAPDGIPAKRVIFFTIFRYRIFRAIAANTVVINLLKPMNAASPDLFFKTTVSQTASFYLSVKLPYDKKDHLFNLHGICLPCCL